MKKTIVLVIMICLISVGISEAVVSEENNIELESNRDSYAYMESIVNRVAKLDQNDFKPVKNDNEYYGNPQPCLGGDEVFGLWINIVYKGKSHLEKISIDPRMIKGKITDPYYRTPIKFNVDDDPDYDIETGFGFFQYGIDEILEDGSYINHPCWTTAFDFQQIFNQLDDQTAELEIWQEFHINLSLLRTSRSDKSTINKNSMFMGKSRLSSFFTQLFERISQKIERFPLLKILLDELFMRFHNDPTLDDIDDNPATMNAGEDYYVIRVGVRSPEGEKIPLSFEKKFACAKEGVLRPFIFQKETDPSDIIGEDNIDVMYGFQGFQSGHSTPSYDIEFTINFNPSVYSMIQFIPREGKITYYYHQVGAADALDITFSSKVTKGGDETEGTLSLTLTLDTPQAAAGSGKWMSFEPEILGDWEPLGGKLIYFASHKFNIGVLLEVLGLNKKLNLRVYLKVQLLNGMQILR